MGNLIVVVSLVAVAALLFSPRLTASPVWRATATPLASIIGSGFLVSLPLLAHDLGSYAVVGMAFLVVFSYLLGGALRFNIVNGEPLFAEGGKGWLGWVESTSHLVLALAYFISVTYYLTLLGAFLLRGIGVTHVLAGKGLTTVVLLAIGLQGFLRGLHGLENIEEYAVGLKLAVNECGNFRFHALYHLLSLLVPINGRKRSAIASRARKIRERTVPIGQPMMLAISS